MSSGSSRHYEIRSAFPHLQISRRKSSCLFPIARCRDKKTCPTISLPADGPARPGTIRQLDWVIIHIFPPRSMWRAGGRCATMEACWRISGSSSRSCGSPRRVQSSRAGSSSYSHGADTGNISSDRSASGPSPRLSSSSARSNRTYSAFLSIAAFTNAVKRGCGPLETHGFPTA